MNFRPDNYLEDLYRDIKPRYSFNAVNKSEWETWRQQLKQEFIKALGIPAEKVPLKCEIMEEVRKDGYIRQRITYQVAENLDIPAYLLIPEEKKGRLPAVIACHGHGYGSREIVGINADGTENTGDPGYQKNFAIELAKRGLIVIAPEILGFGDRKLLEDEKNYSSCHRISTYLLMLGTTMAGLRVRDILRTIDLLEARDDVDASRIGCMGISGGGLVCAFSSAIDERIKAAVVSGYANTFKDSVMAMFHCVDNFIPGIINIAEMPDLIGLIAPRALLLESGTEDPIFPISAARSAYSEIKHIYSVLDRSDNIDMDIFEGDHQISGQKAYNWLLEHLK